MHAGEALDRGAVKADAVGESALKFSRGDRDGLQGTEHVSEPEPDKTNVPLFERAQQEFFLPVHGYPLKRFSRFPRRAGALRRDLALLVSSRYQRRGGKVVSGWLRSGDRWQACLLGLGGRWRAGLRPGGGGADQQQRRVVIGGRADVPEQVVA